VAAPVKHAIEHQRVEVDVEVEAPAEPLDDSDGAGLAVPQAGLASAATVEMHQRVAAWVQDRLSERSSC
jgi:hypothetical protein